MTKEYLFGMAQVIIPIIAKDTKSISQVNAHTIKLHLKNRRTLIFVYNDDKTWSISSEK